MQGRRVADGSRSRAVRKTPAHAGQTPQTVRRRGWCREDPCACRADTVRAPIPAVTCGRPLRMQGRQGCSWWQRAVWGKTPAHAGQTMQRRIPPSGTSEDPCACRADDGRVIHQEAKTGRPLRMQGRRGWDRAGSRPYGKTPAHAGQTAPAGRAAGHAAEDPCACRADDAPDWTRDRGEGRPLRMQGRPRASPQVMRLDREDPCACRADSLARS